MKKNPTFAIILQARSSSKRLPNKIFKNIAGLPMILLMVKRLSQAKFVDKIIVATTKESSDDKLIDLLISKNISYFRGSSENVLDRYYDCATKFSVSNIIRVTSDCPLIDFEILDRMIDAFKTNEYDYLSNTLFPTFPDGLDIEIFKYDILKIAKKNAKTKFQKEHVTPWIKNNKTIKKFNFESKIKFTNLRWTVDTLHDLINVRKIFKFFKNNQLVSFESIIKINNKKSNILNKCEPFLRDNGSKLSSGVKLWNRAKEIIPNGSMLYSKKSEVNLPNLWPSYFSKTKGIYIWDLDNNKYKDLSSMGLGTNILGYNNKEVDKVVTDTIKKGNMSTLNCPEEVYLAEKLIEMHQWASMARFARSGGEANTIAIRLARAFTGREKIAVCGYHGWHDWYLSANISNNKNLNNHLMKNMSPLGVPKILNNNTHAFTYNDIKALEKLLISKNFAAIIMEVERSEKPKNQFLQKVRKLCDQTNTLLIFDECTSGFRHTFGGLHLKYKVYPDMAIFGKALGNGYAITAVLGKYDIMKQAENTFISSTFWTERIGPTAACKTLEIMEQCQSWKKISEVGLYVQNKLKSLAKKNKLNLKIQGLSSIFSYYIESKNWPKYKTFISQEFLKKKIIANNLIYVSILHSKEVYDEYFFHLDEIFKQIFLYENDMKNSLNLTSAECQMSF